MINNLKGHIPDVVLNQLQETCDKFDINTELRLAHFISQCDHESSGFSIVKENLNYSAKRLLEIFPKYFTKVLAIKVEHSPEKIANIVYSNRMGNGADEGYKFSGRGYIQLTGKDNYSAFDKIVPENILNEPTLVATKYPLLSAAWFFNKSNLWKICDLGSSVEVITKVTRKVNGGTIGLKERIELFNKYYKILTDDSDIRTK